MKPLAYPSGFLSRVYYTLAGLAGFDQAMRAKTTVQTRDGVERMVMFATASELVGASMIPPGLIARLLPYFAPKVYQWKRTSQVWTDFRDQIKGGC